MHNTLLDTIVLFGTGTGTERTGMRSWIAVLIWTLLLAAWPGSALAQSKLAHLEQEVRVTDTAFNADGVFWRLEVRDRCTIDVRRVELLVPCSEWRPLQPLDPMRELDFKGEVTLPEGKTLKVRRRGGERAGEEHLVAARFLSDQALEPRGDWALRYLAETPGTWWLPAVDLGGLFFEPGSLAAAVEGWLLELALSSRDVGIRFEAGGSVAGTTVPPADLGAAGPAWRCAELARWLAGAPTLSSADPLLGWFDNLDAAQPVCGEQAQRAREIVCSAQDDLAQRVLLSATAEEMLGLLPVCTAAARNCGWANDGPIASAIARRFESETRQGNATELHRIREAYGPLMGEAWLEEAQRALVAAMDAQLWEYIKRGDTQAVHAFVLEQGALLGEKWRDEALARYAWVDARRNLSLQRVPDNQVVHADLHPAGGLEQVQLVVQQDGAGLLEIRTRDGAPMLEQRSSQETYHLIDLDGDGLSELIRTAVARDDPGLLEVSILRMDGDELVAAWTGLFEGGQPSIPSPANFVPREHGWGFLFAHPEFLRDPTCRGHDCDHRDRAIGKRMWIEYLVYDPDQGVFAAAAIPPETDTLRAPNGHKLRTGGYHDRLRSGVWSWWRTDGRIAIEGVFREGLRHGIWTAWHSSGEKLAEQEFRAGIPHGEGKYWSVDGAPLTLEQLQQQAGVDDPFFIPSVSEISE